MLREASPDEVHLVLSSTANAASQRQTAERFAAAGATALAITKLDEATGLGGLPPLVRACRLPLSYVTHGQNVPADIAPADATALARRMVGLQ
jgi:flagellar biosynthesis protein FlhF